MSKPTGLPTSLIRDLAAWCRSDTDTGYHAEKANLETIAGLLESIPALEASADTAQRDLARVTADDAHNCRLLLRLRDRLATIVWAIADEGDRVYFGSTNDADDLRDIARELDDFRWDRTMRGAEKPDLYAELRKLRNDLGEAERDRDEMKAENARLREALANIGSHDLACLTGLADDTHVVVPVDLIWRLDDALSLYEDPIEYDRASFSGGDGNIVVPDRYDEIGFGDTAANVRGMIPETVRGAISRWLDKIIAARPGAKEE